MRQTARATIFGNKSLVLVLRGIRGHVVATTRATEGVCSGRHADIRQVRSLPAAHRLEAQSFIRHLFSLLLAA